MQGPPGAGHSSALVTVRLDLEPVVLDHVVGEKLLAHRLDALPGLMLAVSFQIHLDVLADAHVGDFSKPTRREALPDRDALRVVDDRFRGNDDSRNHLSYLGLGGNTGLPTRRC